MAPGLVLASGSVVIRRGHVLLVHRPRYDDWSFPKGKVDPGEHLTTCAVREVREETGLDAQLSLPLAEQTYPVGRKRKRVSYWLGRVLGEVEVEGHTAEGEIDRVAWIPLAEAPQLLTYPHDRDTLAEAVEARDEAGGRVRTVIVLRHARARSRSDWHIDDRFRPLLPDGHAQAARLPPVLAAYDARRLICSSSTRCVDTLLPYSDLTGHHLSTSDALAEEHATRGKIRAVVAEAVEQKDTTVICSHRPVLPLVFDAFGVRATALEVGEMLVLHHRGGRILATERHRP